MSRAAASLAILCFLALSATIGCDSRSSSVVAKRIESRADLIGGPGALGEVGDYLLANEQIRVIVQGAGYSRGFGFYGGSLIDADLQRPNTTADSAGGTGFDRFSETFPAFFLRAVRPSDIATAREDDGSARIVVRGKPDDVVFLAKAINDVALATDDLKFENEFVLRPGKRYVEIRTTVTNTGNDAVRLPGRGIEQFLGEGVDFVLPSGDVLLFGGGNDIFSEGAGFDSRYVLERAYAQAPALPRLPGVVVPFLASRGKHVSYGFASGIEDPEASFVVRTGVPGAKPSDLLVPFSAAAFTGAFYAAVPAILPGRTDAPRNRFSYAKYFIVGSGDIASIRDVVHEIRNTPHGWFSAEVRDSFARAPEIGASVITFDATGRAYNQHTTDEGGRFKGSYAPGTYSYRVLAEGRVPTKAVSFEVREGATTFAAIEIPASGRVSIRIIDDESARLMPGKCTLVGRYAASARGFQPHEFLFDPVLGERRRYTDLVPDTEDPKTREFVEDAIVAPLGLASALVRPGHYRAVCSRGMEYELYEEEIDVREHELTTVDAVLRRAFDTTGWASGDFHLHAEHSIDSGMRVDARVAHVAAEGVDVACSSDHNFVTDYAQAIASQGLESWVQGMVGIELTTMESGHFNAFPLAYDAGPITKGSFRWFEVPPGDIFEGLRKLGRFGPERTIIQVNHPRSAMNGYLNDYNVDVETGKPGPGGLLSPTGAAFGPDKFSLAFDAMEILNGKHFEELRNFRVPLVLPPGVRPDALPPAGELLRDTKGKVKFPGAMDDWFTFLNMGKVITGVGNSDTHGQDDEPGIPRTYIPVLDDRPGAIDELEVVAAFQNQRALITTGPFVRVQASGKGECRSRATGEPLGRVACDLGDLVAPKDGHVALSVDIQMARWVTYDHVDVIVNGAKVRTIERLDLATDHFDVEIEAPRSDGWVVLEVDGNDTLFPVVLPNEVPSIQLGEALSSIFTSFGDAAGVGVGKLTPNKTQLGRSYALTNPIFIDGNADGRWVPPGIAAKALRAETDTSLSSQAREDANAVPAILRMFRALEGCGHSH